jgi:predicted enzyme related to lactoylglutathione lyase
MDKVVHFEIPFDDKQRAMKFYQECFGCTVAVDDAQMPKEPGAINGGLFQRPAEAPAPTIYVGVASVEASLAKVTAAGGRIVTPRTPIPGMGAYARVADTEGNVIGLFEGA